MNNNSLAAALIILAAAFLYAITTTPGYTEGGDPAKSISIDQICELYIDYPMSADSIYGNKTVKTTVEVSSVRKIHSICSDAPEGSFTMEITNRSGTILECFCNQPVYKSVLENTPKGSHLSVQGMYKSMTASYSESENKQCKVTIYNCSFK